MRYILNSAVITAPGIYKYEIVSVERAKEWLASGVFPLSTIGYWETAEAFRLIFRYDLPVNRRQIKMEPGDEALVFRLTCRLDDPVVKGRMSIGFVLKNCEIGLLRHLLPTEVQCWYPEKNIG